MDKTHYKNRIDELVEEMVANGADSDQVLNALTETTLEFMEKAVSRHYYRQRPYGDSLT